MADIAKGGYILKDCAGKPELILIATGSEVELAVKAAAEAEALKVSTFAWFQCHRPMPLTSKMQRIVKLVLPADVTKRIAIEAGIADFCVRSTLVLAARSSA
ncbi:transketolase-like TK C-terminal-containing protein [Vibrio metschnikovii]